MKQPTCLSPINKFNQISLLGVIYFIGLRELAFSDYSMDDTR